MILMKTEEWSEPDTSQHQHGDDNGLLQAVAESPSAPVSDNGSYNSPNSNLEIESDPTCSNDGAAESTRKPANRKARKCEKQRERRAMKRRQKQQEPEAAAIEAIKTQGDIQGDTGGGQPKRHRPTQLERSMNFFMTMFDWSCVFVKSEAWLPRLNAGSKLDPETAESISKVVERCWIKGGRSSGLKSLEELEQLVEFKEKEASYVEKQLSRLPALRYEAWKSYFGELEKVPQEQPVEELLGGPAEFLRDTIVPCLAAQLSLLRVRIREVRVLRDKYQRLCQKRDRQEELRSLISGLRVGRGLILPVCPVWKEVQQEIKVLQAKLLNSHDWTILEESRRSAQLAYEEALGSVLLIV